MKASRYREMSGEELAQSFREQRRGLVDMRTMKGSGGEAESPIKMRGRRRDIARVLTVMRELELSNVSGKQQ